ncbi:MAG: SDR family oxidoreductase [Clostridia bacterium]|nr:SDR family oxidoreductase [Clostridia bacterium]
MEKIAVVTGGTSGIGLCTAKALARQGCRVYTLSRRGGADLPGIMNLCADVTDEEQIARAAERILAESGRVDIVVNNAGFGISGAVEFTDTEEAKRQFDVNFFGMVRVNRVFLPILRKQGGGRIVNISSVAAPIPIPFQTYYSAAKAAIDSYTMALANEVRPFGITVCAVRPGDICTGFTAARAKSVAGDDVYQGRIARSVARMEKDEQGGMDPQKAGNYVCKMALKAHPKPLTAIRLDYQFCCFLAKVLPCRLLNRLIGMLYAG